MKYSSTNPAIEPLQSPNDGLPPVETFTITRQKIKGDRRAKVRRIGTIFLWGIAGGFIGFTWCVAMMLFSPEWTGLYAYVHDVWSWLPASYAIGAVASLVAWQLVRPE